MTERIVFLTGHLAEVPLRTLLSEMSARSRIHPQVENVGVQVAALMTPKIILRRLSRSRVAGASRVIVPGRVRGDMAVLEEHFGTKVERGPDDLYELPQFLGEQERDKDLSRHDCLIFSEITQAPFLSVQQLTEKAQTYIADGADVIDIGCLPDTPFPHLEESIDALHALGIKVSVDSSDDCELARAAAADADYLLSVHKGNMDLLERYPRMTPIVIPHPLKDMDSLYDVIDLCLCAKRPFYADPILDPLHMGFTESLGRYAALRKRYPTIDIFMGTANVTELCDSDSAGVVMVLMGMVSEWRIGAVLTVQVSPHCRRVIAETDVARRIFHYAQSKHILANNIDDRLTSLHERRPLWYDKKDIAMMVAKLRASDKAWRIAIDKEGMLHVFNGTTHVHCSDPFAMFPQLGLDTHGDHAFYMGYELAKAQQAAMLGKRYVQDRDLFWGCAVHKMTKEE
ncbi:MAG: dihydropteroate synthase [Alphaproteobacteria bacterium GM7ARS4]|nr:dihydropteroate synthase [Alphaproteobacteria bacterium GM7ARS4]